MRNICDAFQRLYIMGLMLFKPATLFHKIYALPWYQNALHTWINGLGYRRGEAILEIGCATGELTQYMDNQGLYALGVDNSEDMLKQARASTTGEARFELACALNLPLGNNQFDYVIAASLLNIIKQPELVLSEMRRVCKSGGKISVLVPQAGMTDGALNRLANELNLSGFSRAVLTTWNRRAPKMRQEKVMEYFNRAGIHHIDCSTQLNGMVLTVTGILS
jgi:ubiquinone/menaquinone biosynthesis C-methylase UbiE